MNESVLIIRWLLMLSQLQIMNDSWSFLGYFEADDKSELQVFPLTSSSWTKLRKKE